MLRSISKQSGTSSQFSLLAALALHLWSHSLVHPHHFLYE